jgi:hypothetical protein
MAAKTTLKDLALASVLTLMGGALVLVALRMRWNPQDLNPGIEGCLTVGVVGFILALLHPLEYRHAVLISAPVVAVQYGACLAVGGPAAGVVGIELIIFGFVGLGMALHRSRPAPAAEGDSRSSREADRAALSSREELPSSSFVFFGSPSSSRGTMRQTAGRVGASPWHPLRKPRT